MPGNMSYLIEVRGLKLLSVNKRAAPPVVSYRGTWIETKRYKDGRFVCLVVSYRGTWIET